jgi:hypothetical protein
VLQSNDNPEILVRYGSSGPGSLSSILEAVSQAILREKEEDMIDPVTGNRRFPHTSVCYASQSHFSHIETLTREMIALLEPVRNGQNLDPCGGATVLCEVSLGFLSLSVTSFQSSEKTMHIVWIKAFLNIDQLLIIFLACIDHRLQM